MRRSGRPSEPAPPVPSMTDTLEHWLRRIEQLHPAEMELGLSRVAAVAGKLDLLPLPVPVITVAGTNGKGSTLALTEAMLRHAGQRPGLYTSPHIRRFNERIRVAGEEAGDGDICSALEAVESARGDISLTYFEFATLAALWHFRRARVDVCLLEVGLGGRLDAVNIVDADVAVITSIGLDHTDWLGEDRDSIAFEKAGIMRAGRPLIYGETDMPERLPALAADAGAALHRAGDGFGVGDAGIYWTQGGEGRSLEVDRVPLGADNLATAIQALVLAGLPPAEEAILAAAPLRLAGRREHRRLDGVDWYLDVGHNAEALGRFLAGLPACEGRTLAVAAMRVDKPARRALAHFEPVVDHWYLAGLPGSRGAGPGVIRDALGDDAPAETFGEVAQALAAAHRCAGAGDRVLVFGSFLTVSAAEEWFAASATP